ncbi:hypothetical protein ACI3PL_24555, partial [Lacticaseibacillus paracasei]
SDSLYSNGTGHGYIAKRKAYVYNRSIETITFTRTGVFDIYVSGYFFVDCFTPPYAIHNCNLIYASSLIHFNNSNSITSGAVLNPCNG